jgi:hypothetical protein
LRRYFNLPESNPLACKLCGSDTFTHPLEVVNLHGNTTFWYFCKNCGFGGTGLDYLARLQSVSTAEMFQTAIKKGVLTGIDEQLTQKYLKYTQNCDTFWTRYQNCGKFDRSYSTALSQIDNLDHYKQTAKYRMDSRLNFEKLFYPRLIQQNADNNPSGKRVFRGKAWSHITMIPLYDMPMRVSSFLFIDGNPNTSTRISIKRIGPKNTNGVYLFEPGFLAPNTFLDADYPFAVLSHNWQLVLKLQADSAYQRGGTVSPIIGWFPNSPYKQGNWQYTWKYLDSTTKIFWSPLTDVIALREACMTNSFVSNAYYRTNHLASLSLPDNLPVNVILNTVKKSAISWHGALTAYLESDLPHVMLNLQKLDLPQPILEDYLSKAPEALRRIIIDRCVTFNTTSKYVDRELVVSSTDGWCTVDSKTGKIQAVLSNTRCLIDRVININHSEPIYQGRVLVQEQELPFTEYENIFEKNPIQVVKQICINQATPVYPRINVSKEKYTRLIKNHSECRMVHFQDGFGWSETKNALILPNITLSDALVLDNQLNLATGAFHTLQLSHADSLTAADRNMLNAFPDETPYVTALLVSLIPQLFAKAYRMIAPQTVILGSNVTLCKQLFETMLGLPCFNLYDSTAITKYTSTHKCPCLVKHVITSTKNIRSTWIDSIGLHNRTCILTNLVNGLSRLSYGFANMVILPPIHFYRWTEGKLPITFLKCFGNLLKHLSRHVLEPIVVSDNWNSDLIEQGISYIETQLRLPVNKSTLFDAYYDSTPYICDYINLLQQMELLIIAKAENYWSVPVQDLGNCFRQHVGLFDLEKLKPLMQQSGLLKQYDAETNTLQLDTDLMEKSVKRLEKVHGALIRKA